VRCELYHETAKFDKQFKYAEKKNIPFVIIIGEQELESKTFIIKDLKKGNQYTVEQSGIVEKVKDLLTDALEPLETNRVL
jgi:histidyl-tRNA synthetase